MKSGIYLFLGVLISLSCSEKKNSFISGHFVSMDYYTNNSYHTLDISDSTIWVDKFGVYGYEQLLTIYEDTFSMFYGHDVVEFILHNDTIKFLNTDFFGETTFVKIDSLKTFRDDVFCDLAVLVDLPEVESNELLTFQDRYLVSPVSIGKLKKGYQSDLKLIKSDSFLVQVNDVFIDLSQLPEYIRSEKFKRVDDDRNKMILCINADRNTPQFLLTEVTKTIRNYDDQLIIYRAFINWKTRKVSYEMLN